MGRRVSLGMRVGLMRPWGLDHTQGIALCGSSVWLQGVRKTTPRIPAPMPSRPQVALSEDRRTASFAVPIDDAGASTYESQSLTITLVDGARAIERTLVPGRN